ncbi:MAG: DEAD/DEAH box helicase family protein, partial [Ruminococcus sp.]|nr:DEAD/DEAH box helicase family protein [Ruminococcus sp.]
MMLRDYQSDLINKLFRAYDDGYLAPCIVLPCGGGKSVITAEIAKRFTDGEKPVLFLVHRRELVEQIYYTFVGWGVDMSLCKIRMVQTAARRLPSMERPELIITDENHHSLAKTYQKIYDYFPDVRRVGVTATPERMGGKGLRDVNDILIEGVTAKWLIENGYLSPYDYYAPAVTLPKFHVRRGEYDQHEINAYFQKNVKTVYGDVLRHYRRLADGKQAICYLSGIEVSEAVAERFRESGIPAAHIDGDTPKAERDKIIGGFRSGEIRILCNVDLISEGFDVPDCECVILLRPTKSLTLFIQQSMRCMRFRKGKRAVIIDHVNNVAEFGLPDADREWLLDGHEKPKGEAPVKTCPMCFAVVGASEAVCPHCGFVFEAERREKCTEVLDIE